MREAQGLIPSLATAVEAAFEHPALRSICTSYAAG